MTLPCQRSSSIAPAVKARSPPTPAPEAEAAAEAAAEGEAAAAAEAEAEVEAEEEAAEAEEALSSGGASAGEAWWRSWEPSTSAMRRRHGSERASRAPPSS